MLAQSAGTLIHSAAPLTAAGLMRCHREPFHPPPPPRLSRHMKNSAAAEQTEPLLSLLVTHSSSSGVCVCARAN